METISKQYIAFEHNMLINIVSKQMMENREERAHPHLIHLKRPQRNRRERGHKSTWTQPWSDHIRDSHVTCLHSCPIDQTTVTLCAMQHQDHLWLAVRYGPMRNNGFLWEQFIWSFNFQLFTKLISYFDKFDFLKDSLSSFFLKAGCFECHENAFFPILKL